MRYKITCSLTDKTYEFEDRASFWHASEELENDLVRLVPNELFESEMMDADPITIGYTDYPVLQVLEKMGKEAYDQCKKEWIETIFEDRDRLYPNCRLAYEGLGGLEEQKDEYESEWLDCVLWLEDTEYTEE